MAGTVKVLEVRGPNTVRVEIPPCFTQLTPLQNVENLKPYNTSPPPPELVGDEEEFEVGDIIGHRLDLVWFRLWTLAAPTEPGACSVDPVSLPSTVD